jgi:ribosomal protein S18 acetylase RimI-like enzyme
MIENTSIREYQNNDQAQIIQLFFEFGKYLQQLDKASLDLIIVPQDYGQKFCAKMLQDVAKNRGKIYVLENPNQQVVGFIAGVIFQIGNSDEELDCKPHTMGRIIELFINQNYRGQGLGTKLMQKMEQYFKEQQCYKINIEVFAPNVDSYRFYKSHGYIDRNIDLAKKIS